MNSDNIQVARPKASGVFRAAPMGTALPNDASTALSSAFLDLGFVSEDGIVETVDDTNEVLKEMGGAPVLDLKTATEVTYSITPLETNYDVMVAMVGTDNVTKDADDNLASVTLNGSEAPSQVYVFDMRLRLGKLLRIVIPNGHVSEVGEVVYKAGEAMTPELTISCYPDSSGNYVYKYFA